MELILNYIKIYIYNIKITTSGSANSKYAFLGSLRSTAQLISYELILSSALLLVIMLTGSLNLTVNVESQRAVWFVLPLLPIFVIFFIGSIAETNRPPFDLAEAESELVSGFMTEHAAVVFVFFFLAEYSSLVLMCILTSLLFLGGYLPLFYLSDFFYIIDYVGCNLFFESWYLDGNRIYVLNLLFNSDHHSSLWEGFVYGLTLGIKSSILVFTMIWARASFPRIRFDQLMSFCWTVLLPVIFGFVIFVPCVLYGFDIIPASTNISLLSVLPLVLKVPKDSINLNTALPIKHRME